MEIVKLPSEFASDFPLVVVFSLEIVPRAEVSFPHLVVTIAGTISLLVSTRPKT